LALAERVAMTAKTASISFGAGVPGLGPPGNVALDTVPNFFSLSTDQNCYSEAITMSVSTSKL
jgi:hypothetical protein